MISNKEYNTSFNCPPKYGARHYNFSKAFISEVTALQSHKTITAILMIWVGVFLSANILTRLVPNDLFCWFYLPVALLIAGRQGALLQIVHEGSHYLIFRNKKLNHFVGNWLAAYPVGLTIEGYGKGHMQHHQHTNTENDLATDLEKYAVTRFGDGRLARAFFYDVIGLTALRSFLGHSGNSLHISCSTKKHSVMKNLKDRAGQGLSQLMLLAVVFQFDFKMYALLWVLPLVSFNMVLLRIRGIAEHGLPTQLEKTIVSAEDGKLLTRTMLMKNGAWPDHLWNFIERLFIGTLNCNFHHEHHILPAVPFYNLPKLHARVYDELSKTQPLAYAKSYRHAYKMGTILRKTNA